MLSTARIPSGCAGARPPSPSRPDSPVHADAWFDATEFIELDETWFDALDRPHDEHPDGRSEAVPITDDCRRSVAQLVHYLGEVKERELLSMGLAKLLPDASYDLLMMASTLYAAVREKRQIDLAVLHLTGHAASLLGSGNVVARLAQCVRQALYDYLGNSFSTAELQQQDDAWAPPTLTALAVALVVAKHWLRHEASPQRPWLRIPTSLARLGIRAHAYWRQLNHMAWHAYSTPANTHNLATPAFSVETRMALALPATPAHLAAKPAPVGSAAERACQPPSGARLIAFASNATINEQAFVTTAPAGTSVEVDRQRDGVLHAVHRRAVHGFQQAMGAVRLFDCATEETGHATRIDQQLICDVHVKTTCRVLGAAPGHGPRAGRSTSLSVKAAASPTQHMRPATGAWTVLPVALAAELDVPAQTTAALDALVDMAKAYGTPNYDPTAMLERIDGAVVRLQHTPLPPGHYRKGLFVEVVHALSHMDDPRIRKPLAKLLARLATHTEMTSIERGSAGQAPCDVPYSAIAHEHVLTIVRDIRMIGGKDRFGGDPERVANMLDRAHAQLAAMHSEHNQSVLDIPSVESIKALIKSAGSDGCQANVQSFLDTMARSEQAGGFQFGIDKIERLQGLADGALQLLATPPKPTAHLDLLDSTGHTFIALLAFIRTELDLAKVSLPVLNEVRDANDVTALCPTGKRLIDRARQYVRDILQTAVYASPQVRLQAIEHIVLQIYDIMDELSLPQRESLLGLPSASAVATALADSTAMDPRDWHTALNETFTRVEEAARAGLAVDASEFWQALHLEVSQHLFQRPGDVGSVAIDPAGRQAQVLIALLALLNCKLRGYEAQGVSAPGIVDANANVAQLLAQTGRHDLDSGARDRGVLPLLADSGARDRGVLPLLADAHAYVLAGKAATHRGSPDRLRALATAIQGSRYRLGAGDEGAEPMVRAQQIVNQWVSNNVLHGMSLPDYILTRVMTHREQPTLAMLKSWVSSAGVMAHMQHDCARMAPEDSAGFAALWDDCVRDALPLLTVAGQDTERLSLYSPMFFHLYSGSSILAQTRSLQNFTAPEVAAVGKRTLDIKEAEGVTANELAYFALPAQILLARQSKTPLDDTQAASPAQAVRLYFEQRKTLRAAQDKLDKQFSAYSAAYADWRAADQLAKEITDACPPAEVGATLQRVRPRMSFQMPALHSYNITRAYAHGVLKPCPGAPDLAAEFEHRTHRVADSFAPIDGALMWAAIAAMPAAELQFFFAEHATIFTVDFRMSTTRGMQAFLGGYVHNSNFHVGVSGADLLAATVESEERIYALKVRRSNETFDYEVLRIDRNVDLYIKAGILDYSGLTDHYRVEGNQIIDREVFKYRILRGAKPISRGTAGSDLITYLQRRHRAALYQRLYDAGHASRTPLALKLLRSFIPFYSCAEFISSQEKDATTYIGCLMDIFSFVPVGSQAAHLAGRLGRHFIKSTFRGAAIASLRVAARAPQKGIARGAVRQVGYAGELRRLGMAIIDYADPGVMMTVGGASALLKKVAKSLGPKMPSLGAKVTQSERRMMSPYTATRSGHGPQQPDGVRPASLPNEGIHLENYVREPARPLSQAYRYGQSPLDRHSGIRPSYSRRGNFNYPASREFKKMSLHPTSDKEIVGYRSIADNQYVQIYTQPARGLSRHPSDTLTVSSHGGYLHRDLDNPPIMPLPGDVTLKMLTPHGTDLIDPSTYRIINDPELKAYVTIKGKLVETSFVDQSHSSWFLPASYDPHSRYNALGPGGELMNYRHTQFQETPNALIEAISDNRLAALSRRAPRSDLLIVNDNIVSAAQSDPALASVHRVLQLDKQGLLRNANGQRYQTLVFAHCRSNCEIPDTLIPSYFPLEHEKKILEAHRGAAWKRAVYVTRATRDEPAGPWQLKTALMAAYFHRGLRPSTPGLTSELPPRRARPPS